MRDSDGSWCRDKVWPLAGGQAWDRGLQHPRGWIRHEGTKGRRLATSRRSRATTTQPTRAATMLSSRGHQRGNTNLGQSAAAHPMAPVSMDQETLMVRKYYDGLRHSTRQGRGCRVSPTRALGGTGTSGATMATRRAQADGPSPYTRHGQQGPLHIGITPYTFVITRIRDAPRVHLRLNATHSVLHTGCTRGASHHGVTHSATIRGHQRVHLRLNATHSVHTTSRASASTTSGVPAPLPNPPMPRGQGLHHARAPVRATPGVLGRLDKTVAMPLTSTYDSACLALYSTNVTDSC